MNDTIAAISTPVGEGAIAVIRLSGPEAVAVADQVFRAKTKVSALPARMQQFGAIYDAERKLDDVLLSVYRAPASYTGEDVVEINCHGGVLVTRRILELLLARGVRSAEPGEFTQRAYLNGKMDLTQAEAVMDLISAQTDLALRAASEQLEGRLGARIRGLREGLVELLAHIEAHIDFPDEDIDPDTGEALRRKLDTIRAEMRALLATAGHGRVLREGVRTVIYGAPNVGKSSLLNLLLGYERAIVSARPGTTRDVIEEVINLRGYPLRLIDTAGIRESSDEIERAGMERTRREVERADLVLHVVDASQPANDAAANSDSAGEAPNATQLYVLNKSDLGEHESRRGLEGVRISCLKNEGIEALDDAIVARIVGGKAAHRDWSVAINARHQACLQTALGFADAAHQALAEHLSPEFVAEELRAALDAVGEVVGKADSEEILGKIFRYFLHREIAALVSPDQMRRTWIDVPPPNFLKASIAPVSLGVFLAVAGTVSSAEDAQSVITLNVEPTAENPRNSEGSFATLASGRIIFCYSQFYGGAADESPARIVWIHSDDQGRTWSTPQVVVENTSGKNVMSVSLLRLASGKLAMFYCVKNSWLDCRPHMRVSGDDGATWTEAKLVLDAPGYFVLNNDRVIQTTKGRIILPLGFHRSRGSDPHSGKSWDARAITMWIYSDDDGATWQESASWWAMPVPSGSGLQEPGVVERADGSLISWSRTDQGGQYGFASVDHGKTWTAPVSTELKSPNGPASIKRLPGSNDLLALYNDHSGKFPFPPKKRNPFVAAISSDGGKTWPHRKLVEDDPDGLYHYTAIHFVDDYVLLAYCAGDSKVGALNRLRIRRVSLDWLRQE